MEATEAHGAALAPRRTPVAAKGELLYLDVVISCKLRIGMTVDAKFKG